MRVNPNEIGACSICGAEARAFWDGTAGKVWSCAACGCEVLPKLAAESGSALDMTSLVLRLEIVIKNFWRAVAWIFARREEQRKARSENGGQDA